MYFFCHLVGQFRFTRCLGYRRVAIYFICMCFFGYSYFFVECFGESVDVDINGRSMEICTLYDKIT